MKQTDLKPCAVCKQGVAHDNNIAFFRVRIEHMVLDLNAIRRQHGLETMIGNPTIAFHMGEQADIAKCASESAGLVCQACWLTEPAAQVWEALTESATAKDDKA